ncbi:hypothetical protein CHL78_010145 [Romboutsia weinsteinii]|uniref:Transglutaminase domain-containing protein n=1 Tax=Romboutsia weinsteinii TaxID=2020949 RepID=A0A371J3T9_9FIRM|nr:transglutaminase domain-containing protein [Romboutsia weinsteinii]RDY27337.1 hypothetical protein CHL78_010145 [Romboutsia weinsteinii]
MKQIKILKSNNKILSERSNFLQIQDNNELIELRNYILEKTDLVKYKDPEIFFKTMEWVNSLWKHDGINNPGNATSLEILQRASRGENFRCVEYAKITRDILVSLGYIARSISIQSENADYGGIGQSHVVAEVWSSKKEKWVFLDPQMNCYAVKDNIPVSYYEIYKSFNEVKFIFSEDTYKNCNNPDYDYRKFIKNYMGYMVVDGVINENNVRLYLHLDGKRQLLAFQAGDLSNAIFTKNVDDIYFNPNATMAMLEYKEKVDFVKIIQENRLKDLKEMEENLDLFSVDPNFKVRFTTNAPNHQYYELKINDRPLIKLETDTYDLSLSEGLHDICVYSINKQGIKGSSTNMKIFYGEIENR